MQASVHGIEEVLATVINQSMNLKLQRIDEAKKIEIWFSTKIKKRI
jgi:hypothetical protein